MDKDILIPIILCGGSGSRLWPFSRQSYPKQFLSLNPKVKDTLLQRTQKRISGLKNIKDPILVCNEDYRFIVAEQMRQIGIKTNSIILEPFGRNTAPAIIVSALIALKQANDPILLILSSDHEIKNEAKFLEAINFGQEAAKKNRLVTFGVKPTSPETGYGYIEAKEPLDSSKSQGSNIVSFIEKPNSRVAEDLIKDKRFSWNSGIFMFKAKIIIEEIQKYHPEILELSKKCIKNIEHDLDFLRLNSKPFNNFPNISIDVAVMEKTDLGTVIPLDAGWTDIGSWKSVWENSKKDKDGNVLEGNIVIKNTKNSFLKSENRLLVGLGLNDHIVIETSDAILIANKNEDQKVKEIVEELKSKNIPEFSNHKKVHRPWGYYTSILEDLTWQVKIININPGEQISLQRHMHRSEHWVVVSGIAKVEINEKIFIIKQNESSFIPLGAKHRLSNPGVIPLSIIEIQSGSYLGEDDIERFEDNYGRIKKTT